MVSSTSDTSSITLSWNDSMNGKSYLVSWKPVGAGSTTTIGTNHTEVTAKNLLPSTAYRVTIIAEDDTQGSPLTATVTTERARSLSGPITRVTRSTLRTFEERLLDRYSIEEIKTDGWLQDADKTEEGNNIILVTPYYAKGFQRYLLHIVLRNTDSSRSDFSYSLVLRMPDELGTFSIPT